jgi:hypothetical protein
MNYKSIENNAAIIDVAGFKPYTDGNRLHVKGFYDVRGAYTKYELSKHFMTFDEFESGMYHLGMQENHNEL